MKQYLILMILVFLLTSIIAQSANREATNLSTELLDLSGEIDISKQESQAIVSYSGSEAVSFAIEVNGYDVINEYQYASWDSIMNCYQLDLYDMSWMSSSDYFDPYTLNYFIKVSVSADGYNTLSDSTYMSYVLTPTIPEPSITWYLMPNALSVYVRNDGGFSNCLLSIGDVNADLGFGGSYFYQAERLEEDYNIQVYVSYKTAMSPQMYSVSKTLLVPAKLYGDIDGDETLGISDISALIDYLLGYGYDEYNNADVNRDGKITISDVSSLIDKILLLQPNALK